MLRSTNNFIFIVLEKEMEDTFKLGGNELYFDGSYEKGRNRRLYGEVIAVPGKLTALENLYQVGVGRPEPPEYTPGEVLSLHASHGTEITREDYRCTTYKAEYKTTADIEQDVRVRDRVYVHFNSIVPENRIKNNDGRTIYKVAYHNVLCVVRDYFFSINLDLIDSVKREGESYRECVDSFLDNPDQDRFKGYSVYDCKGVGKVGDNHGQFEIHNDHPFVKYINSPSIIPIGGYVLVEPSYDGEVQDIGMGYDKAKVSASGLVIDLVSEPKQQEGIVRYVGTPLKGDEEIVKPGDKILYEKNADWLMKIEGKEYFVIRQRDLLAVIEDEK